MDFNLLLKYLIGLITIISPLSIVAPLIALTWDYSKKELKQTVFKAMLFVFIASTFVLVFWESLLSFFWININSLRAIWGIILLIIWVQMVNSKWTSRTNSNKKIENEIKHKEDISMVPLTMPLSFWPWIISTLIIYKNETTNNIEFFLLFVALFLSIVIMYAILVNSFHIKKYLWYTGLSILEKLSGLILWWLAVQFIVSWIKALWITM